MKKISRFGIWICSKFTRKEIWELVLFLLDVLTDRNPEVKPKDDFKEKHPNYRNFFVDPKAPLASEPNPSPKLDYKELLKNYKKQHGKPLKPVNNRNPQTRVPKDSLCSHCSAPAKYLYFNDGKKRSQLMCKVCSEFSTVHPKHKSKPKYYCPYCHHALSKWKERRSFDVYKCYNSNCPHHLENKKKLNWREKILFKTKPTVFKLRYIYREYHFTSEQLALPAPEKTSSIFNIRKSLNTFCLALTFHISFGLSGRKTALVLKNVFGIPASYQTVLNYTKIAAHYAHKFNLHYKGPVDGTQASDEAYIKIYGKKYYTFLSISSKRRNITSYHIDKTRDTLPATVSILEAIRTAKPHQDIKIITDGNPSYPACIHFINDSREKEQHLAHKKVVGLQNLDSESEEFRPFKQLIERLMRTYKFHTRSFYGFKNLTGALAATVLFVTHYNFLRPHSSLNYSVPVPREELKSINTIQGKWAKVLNMAFDLPQAA